MDDIIPVTCGDCSTYPLHFHDLGFRCPRTRVAVDFLTPACTKQRELDRSDDVIYIAKVEKFRKRLTRLVERMPKALQKSKIDAHRTKLNALGEGLQRAQEHIAYQQDLPNHLLWNTKKCAVYVVQCVQYTKIGYTSTPIRQRMTALRATNPFPLILIGVAPGFDSLERKLHKQFADYHHRFEWFAFDESAMEHVRDAICEAGGILYDKPVEELP